MKVCFLSIKTIFTTLWHLVDVLDNTIVLICQMVYVVVPVAFTSSIFVQKNQMYKLVLVGLISVFLYSCDSDVDNGNFVVGSDYLEINNKVLLIDTLSVEVSTISFDSLETSSQSRILVGNYSDPILGVVSAKSYFELSGTSFDIYDSNTATEGRNFVFDSIQLFLKYDNYYYGDTTKIQSIQLHRLLQKIKYPEEASSFYNTSSINHEQNVLGSASFYPKPHSNDSIVVKLDDTFGSSFFQKLKRNEITNNDELVDYFKGLSLQSSATNVSNVIGFSPTSVLRLYYSKNGDDSEDSIYKEFLISDVNKQFNQIQLNASTTFLQYLPGGTGYLPSFRTNDQAFIQSGTGLACRVDFPNIKQLKYLYSKGTIVEAKLFLEPVNTTYSKMYPLSDSLRVYVSDNQNRISKSLLNYDGSKTYALLKKGTDEFNDNVYYSFSLAEFLQSEVNKASDSRSSLLLTLPAFSKEVNRIVLGGQNNPNHKVKLKIYYITY